ncbi:GNAT family N-acetyltransferase [Tateyamaria pelophila]|uniref:GNAT family N-acetyltransferase n=1 Tax=Tateyamaria pelophila TaxID=328415 RepID=UPI001CC047E2|nr:GNAT family N-acetyltransferase [Tateyamaria pelophila]
MTLRLIQPEDAAYVHGLRSNPVYNTHLSKVTGTADSQRKWIEDYKAREDARQEFYYVIERKDGTRCGLVRLYDIEAESFTWGSWILDENKTRKAALESAVLSFGIGFESLGLARALVDVRIGNTHAKGFYRRLGMSEINRTDQDVFFVYPQERFQADRADHMKIIEEAEAKL